MTQLELARPNHYPCVIIGTSGHARVIYDTAMSFGGINILGFFDDYRTGSETVFDLPILGKVANLAGFAAKHNTLGVIIGVGDNYQRRALFQRLLSITNLCFPSIISPGAIVSSRAIIGPGTVIFAGAVIQVECKVGSFCIVNTSASLDHDASMANFSSLAPHACTGGAVSIGECTSVGINASIIQRIRIADNTVVGAGAVVLHDLPSCCVAVGIPARPIRLRKAEETYL